MLTRSVRRSICIKSPKEAFPKCPHCYSSRISELTEEEVFCEDCDWDSIDTHSQLLAEANIWSKFPSSELQDQIDSNDTVQLIDRFIDNEFRQIAI